MDRTPAEPSQRRFAGRRSATFFACAWVAHVLALSLAPPAQAESAGPAPTVCTTFRVRPQDQVWLVSTRHLGCPDTRSQPPLMVCRYAQGWWQPATLAEFYAADSSDVVTPIWIHGNRIDAGLAGSYGLSVYFELVGKFDHEPPVRFVIWSWPSDQIRGPIKDVRAKAARSDIDAYYLGWFLAGMKSDVRVGVLGYSYGARIVSGALQLVSGGRLLGWSIPAASQPQIRVALWAAAEHHYWYLPGQFHDRALAAADAWFVTINRCDPVLDRYRFLDPCSNAEAVGYAGIYGRNLLPPEVSRRIEEVDVTHVVGGEHNWRPYLYSWYIQDRTRDYVLWHELEGGQPKVARASLAVGGER